MKDLFTLLLNNQTPQRARTPMPAIPQLDPSQIEDFIERTLRERRGLQQALADLLARYDRIPPNNERDLLGRMIDGLKAEIASRNARAMAISPRL